MRYRNILMYHNLLLLLLFRVFVLNSCIKNDS